MNILSSLKNPGNIFRKPELTWGVLGTARVAQKAIIPAIQALKHQKVVALASRDLNRAREFSAPFQIPQLYDRYEDLLSDDNVQAVYIPLPNSEHAPWALKALQAGKHVLVEKPFATSAQEAQEILALAEEKGLVLMEAFMYRYNPRVAKVLELVQGGDLGKLRFIESSFSFPLENPDDIRLIPSLGGGALYDMGCYCVNYQRLLAGREPLTVQANAYLGQSGVDFQMSAQLDFGEQVFGHFTVAFNSTSQQLLRLVGSEGVMLVSMPFNARGLETQAILQHGEKQKIYKFKGENDHSLMLEQFYNVACRHKEPAFAVADSVQNAKVIDALFASVAGGGVPVAPAFGLNRLPVIESQPLAELAPALMPVLDPAPEEVTETSAEVGSEQPLAPSESKEDDPQA